ncbi:hypothetical protein GCM10009624_03450 [Gordonia sinesedis]
MKLRKSVAAAALAGAAVFVVAGCSGDNTVGDATSKVSAAAESAADKAGSAADRAEAAIDGLSNSDAQNIIRTAVNPATPSADLDKVVDTTNPMTKAAIQGFAKVAEPAGYGPDAYTVSSVKKNGDNKADVTVAVKSPHAPAPVDLTLSYVKVDGNWKLSGDAINQLTAMGQQRGG